MSINNYFILSSSSRSRILILKNNNLKFRAMNHLCDEEKYKKKFKKLKYGPARISKELSKIKAISLSKKIKEQNIVGSDTVIELNGKTIDKVKTIEGAREKLTLLSGKTHSIISSISIYYNSKLVWTHTEKTKVKIRKLSKTQITNYLKKCGPKILSSVGCYQVEKNGPRIIENIKGDFFNVMGFPLFPFLKFLINEKK